MGFFSAQIGLAFGLFRCIKEIDIVFVLPGTMFIPTLLAKIAKKKILLYEAQDIIWEYRKAEASLGALLKFSVLWSAREMVLHFADYIIVEGYNVIDQNFLENYRSKIRIGHMYVDAHRYNATKQFKKRKSLVGFIASIDERKGILEFVRAIRQLYKLRKNLCFIIIGRGPLLNEVIRALEDLVVCNRVQIIESIPERLFPDVLNDLELYVLPSIAEGLPNIILEAMACGTPVLVTPVGAILDVIKEGETGFLLASSDAKHIAERIAELLDKPELLEKVSINAYRYIRENFGYEETMKAWRKIFKELSYDSYLL